MNKHLIMGACRLGVLLLGVLLLCVARCAGQVDECGVPSNSVFRRNCTCGTTTLCTSGHVDFSCDELEYFPLENATFPNITCLVITKSKFKELRADHVMQFPNVLTLAVMDSDLEIIRPRSLDGLTQLNFLALKRNKLTKVPRISHSKLNMLELRGNMIVSIDNTTFRQLPVLSTLDLSGNRIREVEDNTFSNNCLLSTIRLSDNPLQRIADKAFDNTNIQQLFLNNTKIDALPQSRDFRERIQILYMPGARKFTAFHSRTGGNRTYPLLHTVVFPYHAQCCQFQQTNYTFLTSPPSTKSAKTVSTPEGGVVCVNRTSSECLGNPSSADISAALSNATEFCSAVNACANCLQGVCPDGCAMPTEEVGSGYDDMLPEVLCLISSTVASDDISPTSTSPGADSAASTSSADIATVTPSRSGSADRVTVFTTMVDQTLCVSCPATPTPMPTTSLAMVTPTPMATPNPTSVGIATPTCTSVTRVSAVCTVTSLPPTVTATFEPTPAPPPPPVPTTPPPQTCDDLCGNNYCLFMHSSNLQPCFQCSTFGCPPPPSTECTQFTEFECGCWASCSRRRKRALSNIMAKYGFLSAESAAQGAGITVERSRRSPASFDCSGDENENGSFAVNIEGYSNPVTCSVLPTVSTEATPTETTPTEIQDPFCVPTLQLPLEFLVDGGLVDCSPQDTPFNPCDDLLGRTDFLRVCIWIVIILALVGNGLVCSVFVGYSVIIRRTKQELFVVHFLYFNLALADLLMGVYLLVIAIQDATTRDNFYVHDIMWRQSHACGFAGFCAMVSTVVSVYILLVITLERTYTIVRVLNHKKLGKRRALVIVLVGWAMGCVIAALPLSEKISDYNSVAICLPFDVQEEQDLTYVVLLLLYTGISFVVIAICYGIILQQILCSRKKNRPYVEAKKKLTGEMKVAMRIFILVLTNFLCWFPIAVVGLPSAFGHGFVDSLEFARWAVVLIFPINACLNPILYSVTTRAFRDNFVLLFSQCGLFKSRAQVIRNAQVGITPSWTSKTSDTSGITRVRNTVVMKFRSLSITSSQSSMTDLFSKVNRRRSTISQGSGSEDINHIAMLNARRRNSALSSDSASKEALGRTRSDSSFSGESFDAVTISNPMFRSTSPENLKSPVERNALDVRGRCKISTTSLGTLPEEAELPSEAIGDEDVIKINPAFCDDEEEVELPSEVGDEVGDEDVIKTNPVFCDDGDDDDEEVAPKWEEESLRDSGVIEGSEKDEDGNGELDVMILQMPSPTSPPSPPPSSPPPQDSQMEEHSL